MTFLRCGILLIALSLGTAACGSSSQSSDSGSSTDRSTDRIVVEDLPPSEQNQSVYEVISQYNSHWLQKRGPTSLKNADPIKVYLNDSGFPYGTVEDLKDLQASNVTVIRYFDAREAQFRFGVGNVSGAILVKQGGASE